MLESTKKSALVRFISVKFKVAHIHALLSSELEGLFSFRLILFFSLKRERNNLYLFPNKFFRELNGLFCIGGYNNFSVHKNECNQIYKMTV